jgi:sec-independent protein translocase protein TatC
MAIMGQQKSADEMNFLEHLEELRWHIIRAAVSVFVVAIVIYVIGQPVFDYIILAPKEDWFITYRMICALSETLCFSPPDFTLETRQLGEQFFVHLKVSFILGIVLAFPYVFWEFWRFIKPGLYPKEQKAVRGIVFICSFLFALGVLFGYFIIAPFAVSFLAGYSVGAVNAPTIASYVNYMSMFTLPAGLLFELPIVVYFLSKAGILTPVFMRTYRRHAFVVILMLAAIITPPDMITQLLIGIPIYGLYEISIFISKRVNDKWEKEFNS